MPSLRDRVKGQKASQTANTQAAGAFIEAVNAEDGEASRRPWEELDKKAVPRTTFNLRLNDYELTLLRWLAEHRDESMQKIAKRTLIPALEQLAKEASS